MIHTPADETEAMVERARQARLARQAKRWEKAHRETAGVEATVGVAARGPDPVPEPHNRARNRQSKYLTRGNGDVI